MIRIAYWLLLVCLGVASCVPASSNWDSLPSEWKSAAVWQCDSIEYNSENPAASKLDFSGQALIDFKDKKICNQTGGIDSLIVMEDIDALIYNPETNTASITTKPFRNYKGVQWRIDINTRIATEGMLVERGVVNYHRCFPKLNLTAADERACFSSAPSP
ncbi:hypothetical protein [Inquilinus sp. CA228]|uniref:hypothetical protein n=1 Tax=Inquilinus sp. CA228 TaxID=3455609 RepID=UPI003F8D4E43